MVVKVAEYTGTLNCKNCVIVPYTNTSSDGEKHANPNTNHCASQTSSFYQHQQNNSKFEKLWHKQFTRWWNWNWQRKRTSLLKKLRKKHFQCDITKKIILTKNQSVECDLPEDKLKIKEPEIKTIYISSLKNGQLHQRNYDYEREPMKPIEQSIPVFTKCSSHINQTYKSRRKRNKQKERVYEGWMREVGSSDTESETDVVVKGELKKKSQKNRMHYLSLRLRKFNSELFSETSDKTSEKSITTTKVKNKNNVTEYKSPISGKIYNLNLSKTQAFHIQPVGASYANSKSCTDKAFLAKPEFECTAQYYKIRNEHFELLNKICEIVNNQTEDKTVQSNFDEVSHKTNNELNKTCIIEIDSIKDVTLNESFHLYSNMDSEGCMPNISRSLPVFMERNPQEIKIKDNYSIDLYKNASNSSFCDLTTKSEEYYDINYIHNNLDVFKSSITETSFIWDYIKKDKL